MGRLIGLENQGAGQLTQRNVRGGKRALAEVLAMYADPVRRRLKVRTALRAGGMDFGNHNRTPLAAS